MSDNFRILVVDTDPTVLDILRSALSEVGEVDIVASAEQAFAHAASFKPDLFLLDVSMPDSDGLDLCRRLKEDWDTRDIPVIFVSERDDEVVRFECYGVGADDFIRKPFEMTELLGKIKVVARIAAEKAALREQAGYAQRTAMSAMVSMGELGVVLQFLSKSFACVDPEALAQAILDAMQSYDLDAAVQLRLAEGCLTLSRNGHNQPLEVSVMKHASQSGRIFQFKTRCAFNYGSVTVLINNMPQDDADRAGRIRDNVALVAEGADARLQAIETDLLAKRRRSGIEAALPTLYGTLDSVQTNYRRNCFELTEVMIDFQENLTKTFVRMGLTESQEEEFSSMANTFMNRVVATQDDSLHIVGDLERLADSLKDLLKR